jgi:hypothetical protein
MSNITDIINENFAQQAEMRQEFLEKDLEDLDTATTAKLAVLGFGVEADITAAQDKAKRLRDLANKETDEDKKDELKKSAAKAEAEAARLVLLKDQKKKEKKIKDEADKEETAAKKKQFEINKGLAIANIWINAASAILGFWAAFAGMGIPGVILAGVATAAVLILAGVQTGLVASQNPGFQDGGVIGGNSLTGDRVQISANSAERVLTARQNKGFEELAFGEGGRGGITINGDVNVVANDVEEFQESLIENERFETARE